MPTVLIVDDSESVRISIRALFEAEQDFTVIGEAVNGLDAISKAEELTPELIILDLSMPIMNGLEAAETLRSSLPATPIFCADRSRRPRGGSRGAHGRSRWGVRQRRRFAEDGR